MPNTFKYAIEDDIILIEDSFGSLVKYRRNPRYYLHV